jgi:GNAT superfamily N-acetyltransferase
MDAREFKLGDVLDMPKRYVVPLYQRQYQWHDSRRHGGHTTAFWLDVAAKAAELLDGDARFDHYVGALLLAPHAVRTPFGATPVVQVVDGQQRLTTTLLMLAALREAARELGAVDVADQTARWTRNRLGHADDDPLAMHKLMPTPVDRDVFFSIMDGDHAAIRGRWKSLYWGGGVPQNTPALALRAYEFFRGRVLSFAQTGLADEADADRDEDEVAEEGAPSEHDASMTIRRSS